MVLEIRMSSTSHVNFGVGVLLPAWMHMLLVHVFQRPCRLARLFRVAVFSPVLIDDAEGFGRQGWQEQAPR